LKIDVPFDRTFVNYNEVVFASLVVPLTYELGYVVKTILVNGSHNDANYVSDKLTLSAFSFQQGGEHLTGGYK